MEQRYHTMTISIHDRDLVYQKVGEILHQYAGYILLRTGYPIKEQNHGIIFIIAKMTNDELGALSGKLGQIKYVKVSTTTINL
jgi:putative iron-only hydrogenase system regulator